jgi:hypothetical protein
MRGNKVQGRFKIDFENLSINEGIVDELRDPVGTLVQWWLWDAEFYDNHPEEVLDPIYEVSNQIDGNGRKWHEPFEVPVIMAQQLRGTNVMNERGFYVVDTLRLVIAVNDVARLLPSILTDPNQHIKDRVVFQNEVFVPTRVLPRGRYGNNYSVVTIDCNMVNNEELVNDSQFQSFVDIVPQYINPPTNTGSIATPVSSPIYDAPNNLLDGGNPSTNY